ncbi:hypothetical protein FZEAL_2379 [Fusarium zealandicum]|uniref:Zn(2)-C6 fungal-type domain-containing protein n=1 Tax=Fusarium zealandicum TaxID=1053134 RepID=A0A8H4XMU7_9HYPO|nr:hypothetical protein FZEAL_2379 [Fusarium zealandicum]
MSQATASHSRRGRSKVKSGCRTCKIRKIKCDQGRPVCHRCLSTGRVCDGYGIWGGGNSQNAHRQGSINKDKHIIACAAKPQLSRAVQPVLFPALGTQEKIYFDWFKCRTCPKLPGTFSSNFWDTLVFQAGTREPAVLHAILALSSAHKRDASDTEIRRDIQKLPYKQEQFTLQQYSKAIGHLQPHFLAKDRSSCRVALIACVVFVCLEFLRGHFKTAQLHLKNGLEILGHMQGHLDVTPGVLSLKPCRESTDDWIVEALSRLHLQVELFKHLYQHPCLVLQPVPEAGRVLADRFFSLSDAWKHMEPILNKIFLLTQQARGQLVTIEHHTSQQLVKAELVRWLEMFDTFNQVQPRSADIERDYQVLRVNHIMASIMADTCLHSDESIYDLYTDQFVLLISQLTKLWEIAAKTEKLETTVPQHLTYIPQSIVDIGWIPPLYFAAVKCRVHRIRVQAIRLLGTNPHREGIWDSRIAACVASKVMLMEEGDFYHDVDMDDDFPLASSVTLRDLSLPMLPISCRMSEVEVELSGAPMDKILLFFSASDPRIAKALQAILDRGVTGVSVTAYYRGKAVIEATAGYADVEKDRPVKLNTIFGVFSATKGVTALAVHLQAERGLIHLDDPVAKYWPEFAANGKESITIEHVLSHRSGIPQMPEGVTPELMADWAWMTQHIANYTPIFPPGKSNAYHVLVYGWILGEVVCRTDPQRRTFDRFVREELCEPLGVEDLFLGVPDSELDRVATLYGRNEEFIKDPYNVNPMPVFPGPRQHNLRAMQQAVDPGAGAITSSSALARIFAVVAEGGELDGTRLFSQERVKSFTRPREGMHDIDEIFTGPVPFGAAGFWVGGEKGMSDPLVGDHHDIIYSPGAGGSLVWADIRDRIAVSIVNNHMDAGVLAEPEPIWTGLGRAIRQVIAEI